MKIIFALTTLVFAATDGNPIAYLCDECNLYDTMSNTIFDTLDIPNGPRRQSPPPPTLNKTLEIKFIKDQQNISLTYLFIFTASATLIGLINLFATVTLLLTERKVKSSEGRTYMKTAILETE